VSACEREQSEEKARESERGQEVEGEKYEGGRGGVAERKRQAGRERRDTERGRH